MGVGAYLSLSGRRRDVGGLGAYSTWALIQGWAHIRINTVSGRAYDSAPEH